MPRERREVVPERGARVHRRTNVALISRADGVVAPEQDAALGVDRPRGRLAGVVQERAEPQRLPARQPSASGRAARPRPPRRASPNTARRVRLQLQQPLEHLERVAPHVEVVVGVLLDSLQRVQLRQQLAHQPGLVHQLQPAQRLGSQTQPAQLVEVRSGETAPIRGECRRGQRAASRDRPRSRARTRNAPCASSRSGSSANERPPTARSMPRVEVGRAAVRVEQRLAGGERHRHRVDREVAQRQVGLDAAAADRRDVRLPAAVAARSRARRRTAPTAGTRARRPLGDRARHAARRRRPTTKSSPRTALVQQQVAHRASHAARHSAAPHRARSGPPRTAAAFESSRHRVVRRRADVHARHARARSRR